MRILDYDPAIQVVSGFCHEQSGIAPAPIDGIYHHEGRIYATDYFSLIRLKVDYPKRCEGMIIAPNGENLKINGFPHSDTLIDSLVEYNKVTSAPNWAEVAWLCYTNRRNQPEEPLFCTVDGHTFNLDQMQRFAIAADYLQLGFFYQPEAGSQRPSFATSVVTDEAVMLISPAKTDRKPVFNYEF